MARLFLFIRTLPVLFVLAFSQAGADVLDDVLERGTLRIGVAEFIPWTMRAASGELIGFEVDLGNKIAKDMGVDAKFEVYIWDDIIPALKRGEIDVIAGGMAITPARALQVNFTRPVAESGVGLATNTSKTQHFKTLDELNDEDVIITTVAGTMAASVAETLFAGASVNTFPSPDLAEAAVLEGRAHAYLASTHEVRFLALQNPTKLDVPIDKPLLASSEALAVKKGEQQLLNFLNAWVTARRTDKWVQTTHDYWFGTLEWLPKAAK